MEELSKRWKSAKDAIDVSAPSAGQLVIEAGKKKRSISYYHYGNITILTITLIVISYFFFKVVSLQYGLSKVGMTFMIGSLALRIIVEMISTFKSIKINVSNDSFSITQNAIAFHRFRKKVHGLFTLLVVGFYIAGFYLLTPEFMEYISLKWMILMHLSFIIGAFFVIAQARIGTKKEMQTLSQLVQIEKELHGE